VDGVVGHVLSVEDAAEKLMSFGVAWLRSENVVEPSGCFIDAALLKKFVGLSGIGQKGCAEEKEKRKRNA
jgi:hypothetical protein